MSNLCIFRVEMVVAHENGHRALDCPRDRQLVPEIIVHQQRLAHESGFFFCGRPVTPRKPTFGHPCSCRYSCFSVRLDCMIEQRHAVVKCARKYNICRA